MSRNGRFRLCNYYEWPSPKILRASCNIYHRKRGTLCLWTVRLNAFRSTSACTKCLQDARKLSLIHWDWLTGQIRKQMTISTTIFTKIHTNCLMQSPIVTYLRIIVGRIIFLLPFFFFLFSKDLYRSLPCFLSSWKRLRKVYLLANPIVDGWWEIVIGCKV